MQKIIPCLWFDRQAEEAVNFYVSIFQNSKILNSARYGEAGAKASGMPRGTLMTIAFMLEGQEFMALNGGPVFTFSPAISLAVNCATQKELDGLWQKLSQGGQTEQCGWLKDKYGVSWQIVPAIIGQMMTDPDPRKSERVMGALLQMKKIDMDALKQAYDRK
jgi:predicted 3-demethylubiquinone-9 3-methyltransferase (glyoxalase superfamily)